jgi:hypothetical protein
MVEPSASSNMFNCSFKMVKNEASFFSKTYEMDTKKSWWVGG